MFIQNQIEHLPNHFEIVKNEFENSDEILLIVSYVRNNGVDSILPSLNNKPLKLLCSFDMGITQLDAIKKLLENENVEIKVYKSKEGTFHSKIWLFKNNNKWTSLIGSANLTKAALFDNVEASVLIKQDENREIVTNSILFFNYLWKNENSYSIDIEEIENLIEQYNKRKQIKKTVIDTSISDEDENKISVLFEFVSNWIDIDKGATSKGMLGSLWRGWYIIPDQGYITNKLILELQLYIKYIEDVGGSIALNNNPNADYKSLLELFIHNRNYNMSQLRMSAHDLFVRQAKNYLLKFGWAQHPVKSNGKLNKKILQITNTGKEIADCVDLECIKDIYSEYFYEYFVNGLKIIPFTISVLEETDNFLTLDEISMFLIHSYNIDDKALIVKLIKYFRSLNEICRKRFIEQYRKYFDEIKEPTGNNVYGNYIKKVKHTISVIGWTKYFDYNSSKFTLTLRT